MRQIPSRGKDPADYPVREVKRITLDEDGLQGAELSCGHVRWFASTDRIGKRARCHLCPRKRES